MAVVATVPEAGETGVAPTVAVVATLSAPIGKASAPVFNLSAGAASLPASVSLDQSGAILTLRPERPLALSTTYMAAVRAPGAAPTQEFYWSFATRDVTSWRFVDGGGLNRSPERDTYFPQLTVLGTKLYASWREMSYDWGPMQLRVAVYNGDDETPQWKFVDGGDATGINWDPEQHGFGVQLSAHNSKLYAIWQEKRPDVPVPRTRQPLPRLTKDMVSPAHIRVAVYNGDDDAPAWRFVDGNTATGINHDTAFNASYPQLTVCNNKLYATWMESNDRARQIRVALYNGDDQTPEWNFVDGDGVGGINRDPGAGGFNPQLTALGTKLYAVWEEHNGTAQQIRVVLYNGNDQAPAWSFVDGGGSAGINRDASRNAAAPELTVHDSRLYATWTEDNDGATQVRVAVFDDSDDTPAWRLVDGNRAQGLNHDGKRRAYEPQLTAFGAKLYATWYEGDHRGRGQIRVAVYNGNDRAPVWTFADGNGKHGINKSVKRSAVDPQLTVFDSRLYISWKELVGGRGHKVHVAVGQ
ncbi:MAG: Ig-like domain-containing protein [Gammaproteobacteria bacterium]|nr:Ig-like domain-containing protein [Gammaproteobacteria bacterium]